MKVHEAFERDPRQLALANNGQARIAEEYDEHALTELRAELETFVCDGQYGDAIERVMQAYLRDLDRARQEAAWVSGFFGSGKSHLLKMLGHLWVDTPFADGSTARSLVQGLPADVRASFQELDGRARKAKTGLVAAAGSLPSGTSDSVRLAVLRIMLRACGLPDSYAQAQFCLWLEDEGLLEAVREDVEGAGRSWESELSNLYVSKFIAPALLKHDASFAKDERDARQVLRQQFPLPTGDITTPEFIFTIRRSLTRDGRPLPLTVLILDEVQQYIGESVERAVLITEIAEAVQTQLDSRVLLVASGQSALAGNQYLLRLTDRFRINVQLNDADVEAVTRKVLLHKKASAVAPVKACLDQHAGEISRHLSGTRIAERSEDRNIIVTDYPLLPTRRRFWEECFRVIDAEGTHSALRSQLRIIHDALQQVAEQPLGHVIPADFLFRALAPDLVNKQTLLNELNNRIQKLDDGTVDGRLKSRLCGLIFLISKQTSKGAEVGLVADAATLSDLLVENLNADSGPFRQRVSALLEQMTEEGSVMKVEEEFRLQTTEGAEWDRAYRERISTVNANEVDVHAKRETILAAAVEAAIAEIKLNHGQAKIRRTLSLHIGPNELQSKDDRIVVWLRDGWSGPQKEVEDAARRLGVESPTIHVFLPKRDADALRSQLVALEASRQVLELKGPQSSDGGKEAHASMASRHAAAQEKLDEIVREIVHQAKVFKGGGSEQFGLSLVAKLEAAAGDSLIRRFPRFDEGDHSQWGHAIKRARDGNDQPFTAVGHTGPTERHPVAREVMDAVGAGATGSEVRAKLTAPPFGWPKDGIDAALIALHREGALRVTLNGQPLAPQLLDQNKIPKAEFRAEKVKLTTTQKLEIRGLYQLVGLPGKSGEEEATAPLFLSKLNEMAGLAGGEPPLPQRPTTTRIEDLKKLAGADQLGAIHAARPELTKLIESWGELGQLREKREADWALLQRLLAQAKGLSVAHEVAGDVEAIVAGRLLLDSADHAKPILAKVASALRSALTESHKKLAGAHAAAISSVEADSNWRKLGPSEQDRILAAVDLRPPAEPNAKSDEDLLRELGSRSLTARRDQADAIAPRAERARVEAAKALEPQVQGVKLSSDTLRTPEDVKRWLSETEQRLLDKLHEGPIVIS